ncbi:MAG: DNA repair and recombination protein RadB [Nanoarchaeota archaeon]|nr:DNA repair and recombination protein RadB [Nanoarchaeota archaeon]
MVKISAGSFDLNTLLHGGYETDIVTVIYGPSGSGKTNFCLLTAVSQAKKGNKVIYIDTEGGFSIERVKQLAPEKTEEVLKNIFLLKPTNFQEQIEAFKTLLKHLKDEVSLIIVDGLTILYRLEFASARNSLPDRENKEMQKINSELVNQIRTLAEISRKREIPCIITNQIYNWDDEKRMVGGDILKYWSKCHIELSNEKGKRTLYIKKHRSLPEKELTFQITNEGIKKRGWI